MVEIQTRIQALGVKWRERMQQRLDETRSNLHAMQSTPRFRDETVEAELVEQIALFEQELANPPI
jgi:hypothetical protein